MNCPNCTARLTVVDSRAFPGNRTKRRLVCAICGERFNSIEKIMTDEEINASDTVPAAIPVKEKPTIDLDNIFATMAENAVVRNGFVSAITGGIYETEEHALNDTIKELKRLCSEQF